jgi:site-specific DNA-methyltransferase (adenine-specific)
MVQLFNGDCLDVMDKLIEDGVKVDLTVTSPPYDNLRTYNDTLVWNEDIWKKVLDKLYKITKENGVVVWIVADATINGSETLSSFKQAIYAKEIGFNVHDTMIWEKPHFANPSQNRCHQIFEYMFIFSKGIPKTFNKINDVKIKYGLPVGKSSSRKKDGTIINGKVKNEKKQFGSRKNIWKINTAGQENFGKKCPHPAMFSLQLAKDHIKSWSNEGDIVFDNFMGSGQTGVASLELKRNFIGIELDKDYFQIAQDRINQADGNIGLFEV